MSLKDLHVGGWYRCRDERMLGNVVGRIVNENTYPFAVVLYRDGKYHDVVALTHGGRLADTDEHDFDLIEFIPECNGPRWKPKKWRKATMQDAMKRLPCRDGSTDTVIAGYRWLEGNVSFGVRNLQGGITWVMADDVEVLDD